ncbi:helix-turn-helix domain-containing protein [Thermoactinomyces sp. CICC 23799]|uniref:helix-turn-helix domain-containing protein n=1 Tax=Thermoactinomyces sp. CICC 23799 TaxID=2767429 RepID=UPI0018DE17E8|nr:helix-turn-helix domain-containing protein [Thermoactinomyces sp. CICC 23799]
MSVEIGSYLRQAREAIGMSLEELQEKTKIQKSFLIAIENGEFDKLPSPFYVRTYLRSYANCVKIEPHHILRQYRKMEQAERLTGVHKAVNPNDLNQNQQTQKLPPLEKYQLTGKMPAVNPSQSTQQNTTRMRTLPMSNQNKGRINAQTALTASKTMINRVSDQVKARRDMGYQQAGILNKDKDQTAQGNVGGISPKKELYPTVSRKNHGQTWPNQSLLLSNTGKVPRVSGPLTRVSDQATRNSGPVPRVTGAMKKLDLNDVPIPSVLPDDLENESKTKEGERQRLSRVERLSRSASKSRRSFKISGLNLKSPIAMAVAGLILCIPLGWAILSFTGDDTQPDSNSTAQTANDQMLEIPPEKKGKLQLAQQDVNVVHYRLQDTDQIVVMVHAAGGKSRVELRTDLPSEGGSDHLIKDVTLPKDEKWSYKYTYEGNPDFYVGLSAPEDAIVYVNGQVVKSARYIHVRRVD